MVTHRDAWYVLLLSTVLMVLFAFGAAVVTLGWVVWHWALTGERVAPRVAGEWWLLLNALLTGTVLLTPIFLRGRQRRWQWRAALRWQWTSGRVIALTVLATVMLNLAVSQGVLWLAQFVRWEGVAGGGRFAELLDLVSHRAQSLPLLLVGVVLPALPEEMAFRGVVQQGFEHRYAPTVAIVLSSLAFALFHLDPLQGLAILPTSLFWGWVAFRAQSIVPTVAAHAFQNGVTAATLFAMSDALAVGRTEAAVLSQPPDWRLAVGGLLLWAALTWQLRRHLPQPSRGVADGAADTFAPDQVGVADGRNGSGSAGANGGGGPAG